MSVLLLTSVVVLVTVGVCTVHLWRRQVDGPLVRTGYLVFLAVALSLFWTAVFFPAIMTGDSINQWSQAMSGSLTSWHPPLMAMLMWLSQRICVSPALFTFVQGALFWMSAFCLLAVLIRPVRWWLLSCLVMAANPFLWVHSAVLWKSVWTTTFTLFAAAVLVPAARRGDARRLAAGSAVLAIAVCFRHNALTLVCVPAFVGWFYVWSHQGAWRRTARAILLAIVIALPAKLLDQLPFVESDTHLITCQLALPPYVGVLHSLEPAHPTFVNESELFDKVFGAGKLGRLISQYEPLSGNCMGYIIYYDTKVLELSELDRHRAFLWQRARHVITKHPALFLKHKAILAANLLQITGMFSAYPKGIADNDLGITEQSHWPLARQAVYAILHICRPTLFFRHYIYVGLLLVLLPLWWVRRNASGVIVAVTGLSYWSGFLLLPSHADWRYLLPTYLCGLIALLLAGAGVLESRARRTGAEPAS